MKINFGPHHPINLFLLTFLLLPTGLDTPGNETSYKIYRTGIDLGIINPEKYPFASFQRDEQNVFKDLYKEYITTNGSLSANYNEWLVINNFGILPDTQESLFERKITKRSTADNKRRFINTVRKRDILITGRGIGDMTDFIGCWRCLEAPAGSMAFLTTTARFRKISGSTSTRLIGRLFTVALTTEWRAKLPDGPITRTTTLTVGPLRLSTLNIS